MPLVVSLSTIPPRFPHLGAPLRALLRQTAPVAEVQLWIPRAYRRFPDWDGRLPEVPEGVTIRRCDEDMGPATKVLPAVRLLAGQVVDVLYCDDDKAYDRGWAARFLAQRALRPGCAIVEAGWDVAGIPPEARPRDRLPRMRPFRRDLRYRLHRALSLGLSKPARFVASGFSDVASGYGGVLVRPGFLTEAAFRIPDPLWMVDDPWLSGNLELNGVPIWLNAAGKISARRTREVASLKASEFGGVRRPDSNRACVEWYRRHHGIWMPPDVPPDALPDAPAEAAGRGGA